MQFGVNGNELAYSDTASRHVTFSTLGKFHSYHYPTATRNPVFLHSNSRHEALSLTRRHAALVLRRPPQRATSAVATTPHWNYPPGHLQLLTLWHLYFIYNVRLSLCMSWNHNFDIRWMRVISHAHRLLYPQRKSASTQRLRRLQFRSGRFGKTKNKFSYQELHDFSSGPCLITKLTMLSQRQVVSIKQSNKMRQNAKLHFLNSILFVYSLETASFGHEGKEIYLVLICTSICYEWYPTLCYRRLRFHVMGKLECK
jgi:hypothetical protein